MGIGTTFLARFRRAIALEESRGVDVDPIKLAKELIRQERRGSALAVESASRIIWADVPHWGQQAISKL
jgi:hypothetical protein